MVEKAERQAVPELTSCLPTLLFIVIAIPCVAFLCSPCHGFTPLLKTIPILILSTIFIATLRKTQRSSLFQNRVEGKQPLEQKSYTGKKQKSAIAADEIKPPIEYEQPPSTSKSVSDSAAILGAFNIDTVGVLRKCRTRSCSNLSISDYDDDSDEGLIEIALPGYDSNAEMEDSQKRTQQSVLGDSALRQDELLELLEVMNGGSEAETLIEIDISMGSIKRPRNIQVEA